MQLSPTGFVSLSKGPLVFKLCLSVAQSKQHAPLYFSVCDVDQGYDGDHSLEVNLDTKAR